MAISDFNTEVLHSVAASSATGRSTSIWRQVEALEAFGTHIPIQVTISAGTATVLIEGRVGPGEAWVQLSSSTASDVILVPAGIEYVVNVSAAAVATIRVVAQKPMRRVA
jgi:hypothetical protein